MHGFDWQYFIQQVIAVAIGAFFGTKHGTNGNGH